MKRINRKQFKKEFLEKFADYKEVSFSTISNKNMLFFANNKDCEQITIEFIPQGKYLYTIYINADNKDVNNYIINYFQNLQLNKNYIIADRLNNVEIFC